MRRINLIIFLIVILLFGVGGFAAYRELSKRSAISSYDECIKTPGGRILEMYPQVCVTYDGKQFTQPIK